MVIFQSLIVKNGKLFRIRAAVAGKLGRQYSLKKQTMPLPHQIT